MKKFISLIPLFFYAALLAAQPASSIDTLGAGSVAGAELQKEFSEKTPVHSSNDISDDHLISYFSEMGLTYDSSCFNLSLYREIYGWIGTRYQYAGLTRKGVDCAGFVKNVCNAVFATQLSGNAVHHFEKCDEITDKNSLEEGDLVFFKINQPNISHVGLYLGNGKFVHAAVHGGVMINDLNENYYAKYYYTGGRLKPTQFTSNGN